MSNEHPDMHGNPMDAPILCHQCEKEVREDRAYGSDAAPSEMFCSLECVNEWQESQIATLTAERDAAIQNYDRFLTEWFEDSTDYDRLVDVAESHVDPEGWLSTECRRIHDVFLKRFEEKMNDDE